NDVNKVTVCKNLEDSTGALYTVIEIQDHEKALSFLRVYEEAGRAARDSLVETYQKDGVFCAVYPYVRERPIDSFYRPDAVSLNQCEEICINAILACMASQLPWPILYLILEQRLINLARDNGVYLGYCVDLKDLDESKTERDCTVQCARLLLELLQAKSSKKAVSFVLLQKKIGKSSYNKFTELYKDVRIAAAPKGKKGFFNAIKAWFFRNRDLFFRILLYICVALVLIAIVSLITQLIFGDVPWLRLFTRNFERIGTESLLQ
ncbi:MAG: hypothetical protein IJU50_10890, partial [Lachnospiraceae bacterium]|nr:hypothetical protein [Lachnospiraceae bacterium]